MVPDALSNSETLTQYGHSDSRPPFRNRPREWTEDEISLIRGPLGKEEAARAVRDRRWEVSAKDQVRQTTAGRLRMAGFSVTSTGTPRNPGHVSVRIDLEKVWDDDACARFDECFGN